MKRYIMTDEWKGARIDRFAKSLAPGCPFTVIQMMLRKGKILLNGGRVSGSTRLRTGDTVETDLAATPATRGVPVPDGIPSASFGRIGRGIDILYEDDETLVIDKPRGLPVQPGNEPEKGSLLDLLREFQSRRESVRRVEGDKQQRSGTAAAKDDVRFTPPLFSYTPVHRLDAPTTGALIVAKTRPAARELSRAFATGRIGKTYLAVVAGTPEPAEAVIDTPIKVRKEQRSTAETGADGKPARTSYRILRAQPEGGSVLEIVIGTGRTHQIRAHLASIGHPIVGETRYGREESWTTCGDPPDTPLLLHAWKLLFSPPGRDETVEVTAPPPGEFEPAP